MGLFSNIKNFFCDLFGIETKEEKEVRIAEDKESADPEETHKPTPDEQKKEKEREWKDQQEDLKYVCQTGKAQCQFCNPPMADLIVTSNTIMLQDKPFMTVKDKDGKVNFNFTGVCTHPSQQKPGSPPPPCKAVISLGEWKDFSDTKINDDNALLVKSKIPCMISGQDLKIIESGQKAELSEVEPKMKRKPKISRMYWKDENEKKVIKTINKGETALLFAITKDFEPGDPVTIPLRDPETLEVLTELEGTVGADGIAKIKWTYE